jgi:phosphate transport system substrate-binding protein
VLPDEAAIVTRRYPLARRAYAFLNRKPDASHDARVTAFLAWVLSPRGQALLAEDRGYLPLDPATARAQRAILEERR